MALDTFMNFGDIKGESTDSPHKDWIEKSTTTVQVRENSLEQLASRLGVNHSDLLAANPHIKDPSHLSVGQEIFVPPNPTGPKSQGGTPEQLQAKINQGIQQAAQNLDQILGAVAGNTTLAPVDSQIHDLLEGLQNKESNEDQIKDAVKSRQESGDSQLQEAAQKLEEITGAVTENLDGR